jgi:murein L,D-transpeptidase YafK
MSNNRLLMHRDLSMCMRIWIRVAGVSVLLMWVAFGGLSAAAEYQLADKVLIEKSARKLYLLRQGQVLKTMDIALGLVPEGDKQQEGDFRTPEGRYLLTKRNPASDFFLSIQISYPDARDVREASRSGVSAGSQIMIHGQPNNPSRSDSYYRWTDWTNGCIAVSNSNMVDLWLMTAANTLIEITP